MIPGSNILNMALRVIAAQPVDYFRFASRSLTIDGLDVTNYDEPVILRGSIQAIPRSMYAYLGLDFQKNYINFFVSTAILDVERDISGDQLGWSGRQWQCISVTPWYGIDGWVQVLSIDVGPAVDVNPSYTWGFDTDHANFDNGNFNDAG